MNEITIAELLPHQAPMLLLDRLLDYQGARVLETRIGERHGLLLDERGNLPAWVGLELMAQTIAAWAGMRPGRGEPVRIGMLLGSRSTSVGCRASRPVSGSSSRPNACWRMAAWRASSAGSCAGICPAPRPGSAPICRAMKRCRPCLDSRTDAFLAGLVACNRRIVCFFEEGVKMNSTVLVTGASKGIGRAIALRLAADGFHVVVHHHSDREGAEGTLSELTAAGGQGRLIQFDISDREQCRSRLEGDIEAHGAYYGVVCNAGVIRDGAFPALTDEEWDGVVHTNLTASTTCSNPRIMPMIGCVGAVASSPSSVSGIMGNRGQVNYSAAKAGIIGASKALALELAKRRITVNCVAPASSTPAWSMPRWEAEALKMIPLKRMGQADEVAGLVSHLMSDIAGYVTRQVISINGGLV